MSNIHKDGEGFLDKCRKENDKLKKLIANKAPLRKCIAVKELNKLKK
tara:strand:- start:1905 stop:2045 length:141 start_codon:yes stop_codon:yes gene_type:complete